MRRVFAYALVLLAFAMTGCATRTKMAFGDDADRLTEKSKPVYLMTATIRNNYKTFYQPKLLVVNVERADAKEAADRINFTIDDKAVNAVVPPEVGNSYLLRLELDAGSYEIRGLTSQASVFPFNALFFGHCMRD